MQKKIVVGMSGGVDSSVAALLLKKQGYDVIGIFMKNYSDTKNELTGECNWREERRTAARIASILEIPFFVVDYEKQYKKFVIREMFKDYSRGLTPNPDILCNKIIKFPALFKEAKKFGADLIATGHYARVKKTSQGSELLRGKDRKKDQSYFLYELTEKDLSHILFPVGNLTKEEVRAIAKKNNFPNWEKKGTSGICFVGKVNMKEFLKKKIKEKEGNVLSSDGEIIGEHRGANFFTIGERVGEARGVKIFNDARKKFKEKLYVAEKIGNEIIVAPENHPLLKRKKVFIKNLHFVNRKKIGNMKARIRHLGELNKGKLRKEKGNFIFEFDKSQKGIAEGQSLVLYDGEKVVGGGEMRLR